MQLVEAAILFFVGLIAGVLVTTFDVYAVGSAAFSSRVALLVLASVLYGANVRDRRTAAWGSLWLNLGFVEMYYLTTSYTYAGLARSAMVPLALLALVGALVSVLAWTAKSERNLYGVLISAFLIVATLVACAITHDGPTVGDVVCVALSAYILFAMRPRRFALSQRRVEVAQVDNVPAPADGVGVAERARRSGRGRDEGHRDGANHGERLSSSPRRRPAGRRSAKRASDGRTKPATAEARRHPARGAGKPSPATAPKADKPRRPSRSGESAKSAKSAAKPRRSASTARSGKGADARTKASASTSRRPTRRTGGPMPTTDVIHTRSGAGSSRQGQAAGRARSGSRGHRSEATRRR